jgi:hypothetical protein
LKFSGQIYDKTWNFLGRFMTKLEILWADLRQNFKFSGQIYDKTWNFLGRFMTKLEIFWADLRQNLKFSGQIYDKTWNFLSRFMTKLEIFWADLQKKPLKYQSSWKYVKREPSCSVRTKKTKLKVAFRNFANKPKKHQDALHSLTHRVTSTETIAAPTEKRSCVV